MSLMPRLRAVESWVMVANAGSLVGTQVVTSVLGLGFWLIAARRFSPAAVGFAAAAISAMTLLGFLGMVGLGTLLMGELPASRRGRASLISTALITAGAVGAALGLAFTLIAPRLSKGFLPLTGNLPSSGLFTLAVALTAVGLVLDAALIGLLRGHLQLARNIVFAASKLAILIVAATLMHDRSGLLIVATWVLGSALSLAGLATLLIRTRRLTAYRPRFRVLRHLAGPALGHHALNLGVQLPGLALPVLVATLLSVRLNAAFYVAWNVVGFLFVIPAALTSVLYAMGSGTPAEGLAGKIRFSMGVSLALALLADGVLVLAADPLLSLFGHSYAAQAAWTMRILALGVFPLIVKTHYIAICRIRRLLVQGALVLVAGGLLELLMAGVGASRGRLIGLSLFWVAAVCIEAVIMGRPLYRAAFPAPRQRLHLEGVPA